MDTYKIATRQCLAYVRAHVAPQRPGWVSSTQQIHAWAMESGVGPGAVWRAFQALGTRGSDLTSELNGLTRMDLLMRLDRAILELRRD